MISTAMTIHAASQPCVKNFFINQTNLKNTIVTQAEELLRKPRLHTASQYSFTPL